MKRRSFLIKLLLFAVAWQRLAWGMAKRQPTSSDYRAGRVVYIDGWSYGQSETQEIGD